MKLDVIEASFIIKLLSEYTYQDLKRTQIKPYFFTTYQKEMLKIFQHAKEYGQLPSLSTFYVFFPDFPQFEVKESFEFLVKYIKEEYLARQIVTKINSLNDILNKDPNAARIKLTEIAKQISEINTLKELKVHNLIKDVDKRLQLYEDKVTGVVQPAISTGLSSLDKLLGGGILHDDMLGILARTGEGKSWMGTFLMYSFWKQNIVPLVYSGEMSEESVGYRFDTFLKHFDNSSLNLGNSFLGNNMNHEDYKEYCNWLQTLDTPIYVITPTTHLDGKYLTIPILEEYINLYNPGVVIIDQLSLMEDYRRRSQDTETIAYKHLAQDLHNLKEKFKIPFIVLLQANRKATELDGENPKIEHIEGSDKISHYLTKIWSLKKDGDIMVVESLKDRNTGGIGKVKLLWNVGIGIIQPYLSQDEKGIHSTPTETSPENIWY